MEAFRQFLKSWLGKLLLVLFLSPLALLGVESYFTSRSNPDVLVSVDEQPITQQEFNLAYQPAKDEQLERLGGDASQLDETELKKQVLESMIDKAVLEKQSQKLGLMLTDAQLTQMVRQDPNFQINGEFSQNKFETLLKNNGLDKRGLFARMRNQMAMSQLIQMVSNTGFMTKAEQEALLKLQSEERQVWIHRIDASDFSDQVNVTDKQIQDYFSTHKSKLKTKRTVDLQYISLDKNALTVAAATPAEVTAAYEAHVQSLRANQDSEKRKASHILFTGDNAAQDAQRVLAEIKAGGDFAVLAQQHSKDDESKSRGGQLDFLTKNQKDPDPAISKAVFELKQVGDVSEVVNTPYGSHIIKLDEIKGTAIPSKDTLEKELTNTVTAQKRENQYQDLIKAVNDAAVDGKALGDIAAENNLKLQKVKDFEDNVINAAVLQGHGELNHPDVKKQIFDEYNLQEQTASVGVAANDNMTVWVQSSNYRPVREKTLAEASPAIKALLARQQATALAKTQAEKLASTVNAAKTVAVLGADGADFEDLGKINRQVRLLNNVELTGVFSVVLPAEAAKGKQNAVLAKAILTDSGYTVAAVQAVPLAEQTQIPAQFKKQLAGMLTQLAGDESFKDYLRYLKTQYKIERNQKMIDQAILGKIDDEA